MTTVFSVNWVTSTTPVARTETQHHNSLLGLQGLCDALPQQSQNLQTQESNLELCVSLPQLLCAPINRLGSLRMDVMFSLSLPHAPLVMAADVHWDVSPKGIPQPEDIRLDSSETTGAKIKWLINQR